MGSACQNRRATHQGIVVLKHVALWSLVLLVGRACSSSPTSPTPSPGPDPVTGSPSLMILAPTDAVTLGGSLALAAELREQSGQRTKVTPQWSSSMPSIASIDQSGSVAGLTLGSTTITAVYQNLSASQALLVVNDFSGTWRGEYVVEQCNQLSGEGSSYCRFIVGVAFPFQLSLTQQGQQVSGTVNFYSTGGRLGLTGPATGTSNESGTLELSGTAGSVTVEQPETRATEWRLTLGAGNTLDGRFVADREFRNFFGPVKSREECIIRSAQRVTP